jgi:hypothetical protein
MVNYNDILLDEGYDLLITDGDLRTGDANHQHQALLILTDKGSFKQSPDVGVGLYNYILDDGSVHDLHAEIQKQLELDGAIVISIRGASVATTELEAVYEN